MIPPVSSDGLLARFYRRVTQRRASVGTFAALLGLFAVQADVKAIDVRLLHQKAPLRPEIIAEPPNALSPTRQAARAREADTPDQFGFGPFWLPLGPSPIPNGQTLGGGPEVPVSGRVSVIAIDPNDSNVVYVGGAQGGVFRTLDGGQTLGGTYG
jgi:hypothetical protein